MSYTRYSGTYKLTKRSVQKEKDIQNLDLSWDELKLKYPELIAEEERYNRTERLGGGYDYWYDL